MPIASQKSKFVRHKAASRAPVRRKPASQNQANRNPTSKERAGIQAAIARAQGLVRAVAMPKVEPCAEVKAMMKAKTWQEMVEIRGWMVPGLMIADEQLQGRWDHWARIMFRMSIGTEEIPKVHWCDHLHNNARKVWEKTLNAVTRDGGWQGWSSWRNVDFLFDWLLFGFGHKPTNKPKEDREFEGATKRILDVFDLPALLKEPNDYLGDILAENCHGKHMGFYPTPMSLTRMMIQMTMAGEEGGMREKSVMDPCVGTGRMLLAASDYSYRLYGMDIDGTVIKATLLNGFLYAPWLVRPFPWLDLADARDPVEVSEAMAAQAPAHAADTEPDLLNGHRFAPIVKRRRVTRSADGKRTEPVAEVNQGYFTEF